MHSTCENKRTKIPFKSLFVWVGLAILISLFEGCAPKFEEAQMLFDQGYFGQAAVTFESVSRAEKDKRKKETAYFMAGESYRLNNKYDKALKYYEKVLKTDPNNTQALLMRAHMLKELEDYRKAMDAFDKYLEKVPGDSVAMMKKDGCLLGISWTKDSSLFVVKEFKKANSKANDWAPMVADRKDQEVYFASDREGGYSKRIYGGTMETWSDIWSIEGKVKKSRKKGASTAQVKWEKPSYNKGASTKFNEGGVTFNSRYSEMYLGQCGGPKGRDEKCAIYQVKKQGPDWVIGEPLDICKQDTAHSYGHPALGEDDKILYFSSDREGGFGGFDIWAVTYSRRSRTWGNPVNLGPDINSPGNEYFPYYNKYDKRLFFSSDYWPGLGGLDMFAAEKTDDITKWEFRENLREPLNSGADDFGISFKNRNEKEGFFTSNRGRKLDDNIYEFNIIPLVITIRGLVTDCNTGEPLEGATVLISNDRDTSIIRLKADENGEYRASLNPKTNYEIVAKYPELYYFDIPPVSRTTHGIRFSTELEQDFCLVNPLDQIIALPIFYDLDSAAIRPDAAKVLDQFAQDVLVRYPKLMVELGSHTDCRASVEYNRKLAQRRADSATNYLIRRWNIDSGRIRAVGFGEKELINDCRCEGAEVQGFTPYIAGTTKKMIIKKDSRGNVVSSYYEPYPANEIQNIDGKPYVKCDEFQHQQNRRTTVRFEFEDQKSRVDVNLNVDANNTNKGANSDSTESANPAINVTAVKKKAVDTTYAIRTNISTTNGVQTITVWFDETNNTQVSLDEKQRYNLISPELAAEWYDKDIIRKKDFVKGDKFKVGKVKMPGNKFVVQQMFIGMGNRRYEIKGVQFRIDENATVPVFGKSITKKYFHPDSYINGDTYMIIPRRVPREWRAKKKPARKQRQKKTKKTEDKE